MYSTVGKDLYPIQEYSEMLSLITIVSKNLMVMYTNSPGLLALYKGTYYHVREWAHDLEDESSIPDDFVSLGEDVKLDMIDVIENIVE
ncbi:hypothetical protein PIB30_006450 [Stylosanthes scabra]|uniref:Uncharacterized protein n=1 Tax=Stylosanthes scabra TaxID=79078 RepID=A0ABU6U584_9FABA|nr:hypothetical protein [Stylosanthes scabra]